jgi:hypothetical protein
MHLFVEQTMDPNSDKNDKEAKEDKDDQSKNSNETNQVIDQGKGNMEIPGQREYEMIDHWSTDSKEDVLFYRDFPRTEADLEKLPRLGRT